MNNSNYGEIYYHPEFDRMAILDQGGFGWKYYFFTGPNSDWFTPMIKHPKHSGWVYVGEL